MDEAWMPPGEVFLSRWSKRTPWGRSRKCWRDYISAGLGTPECPPEELEKEEGRGRFGCLPPDCYSVQINKERQGITVFSDHCCPSKQLHRTRNGRLQNWDRIRKQIQGVDGTQELRGRMQIMRQKRKSHAESVLRAENRTGRKRRQRAIKWQGSLSRQGVRTWFTAESKQEDSQREPNREGILLWISRSAFQLEHSVM